MKAFHSLLLLAASLTLGWTVPAFAEPSDIHLKIESGTLSAPLIAGESTYPGHVGEIDIASFKLGVTQKGLLSAGTTGAGAGKSQFTPLTVYKYLDKATPQLFVACALGSHYKTATLTISEPSNTGFAASPGRHSGDFFTVVLQDVFVVGVNQDASSTDSNGNLLETIDLSYLKITWSYTAADGSVTSGGFDVVHNKKLPASP